LAEVFLSEFPHRTQIILSTSKVVMHNFQKANLSGIIIVLYVKAIFKRAGEFKAWLDSNNGNQTGNKV